VDGKSEIIVRAGTEAEDETWRQASDAFEEEIESETEGDSGIEDDSDDDVVYLIPVMLVEGDYLRNGERA
jgi:hypothetical protein